MPYFTPVALFSLEPSSDKVQYLDQAGFANRTYSSIERCMRRSISFYKKEQAPTAFLWSAPYFRLPCTILHIPRTKMRRVHSLETLLFLGTVVLLTYAKNCVPPVRKNFYYTKCLDNFRGPIEVLSVDAHQNGKTVEDNGGLDLSQPLNLTFRIKNNYNKKEVNDHRFDFVPYQFADDDGGPCDWYELETGGTTSDIDGCDLIKNNCRYVNKPDRASVIVDFPRLLSDFNEEAKSLLEPKTYYAFEITERDGKSTKLSCTRMQALLKKV